MQLHHAVAGNTGFALHARLSRSGSFPPSNPLLQVRKEARAAIQRERDQQIALMIAK